MAPSHDDYKEEREDILQAWSVLAAVDQKYGFGRMIHNVIESYLAQAGYAGVMVDYENMQCRCGRQGEMLCRDPLHYEKCPDEDAYGYNGNAICFICYELGRGLCAVCRGKNADLAYLKSHRLPLSSKSDLFSAPDKAHDFAFAQAALEALVMRWDAMEVYEQVIKRLLEELCHGRPSHPKDTTPTKTNKDDDFALAKTCLAAFANKYGVGELYHNVIAIHLRDWDADNDMFEEMAWILREER